MVNYSPSAHYRLAASIDLLGICWRTAVIPFFGGTFDGNNLTITHLTIGSGNCVGLFGQLESGAEVKDLCVVDVNISGSDYAVGGLVGVSGGTVMQCHSTGTVSGDSHVGGLVGYNYGTVTQCYSTGVVSGIVGVGGLVGYSYDTLTHCYSTCVVDGNDIVGGLVGENWGAVTNCYSVGAVTGNTSVGGLLGNVGIDPWSPVPTATNSFWDTQTSGQATSADGTGKTTAEMQTANTFLDASWDFVGETANGTEDIWWIDEGRGYPRLWWELIPEN